MAIGFYVFFVGMFTAKNVYWALLLLCRLFITIAVGYTFLCKKGLLVGSIYHIGVDLNA